MKSSFVRAIDAAREELRGKPSSGHAHESALRKHSVGDLYPFHVVPVDGVTGRRYEVWNLANGCSILSCTCYAEAEAYARIFRAERNISARKRLTPREEAYEAAERGDW